MLKVDLQRAKAGMTLALPIQNPQVPARTLLKAGYALEEAMIDKLGEMGIRWAWVKCPALEFIEKYLDRPGVEARQQVVTQIADTFETLQEDAVAKLPFDAYTGAIESLVDNLMGNPASAIFLGDLAAGSDDLMRHSSTVTYLSLLMGLKLEGYLVKERKHVNPARAKEVLALGVGAMLHDIGLTLLDDDTREQFEQTGDDTDPAFKEHTALGFEAVRGQVDPSTAIVMLHHHQRFDGQGFTGERFPVLEGKRIHVFARIVAVADAFDQLRCPAKLPEQPAAFVLHHMVAQTLAGRFDPQVLTALLDVVPPFAPGSTVRLSDGRTAVVTEYRPETPCLPSVQVVRNPDHLGLDTMELEDPLHLADTEPRIVVAACDGHDVTEYAFARPDPMTIAA